MEFNLEPNLVLKTLQAGNAAELFALVDKNRDYLKEWLPWLDYNRSVKDSESFIATCTKQLEDGRGFACGIWLENILCGVVSYHPIDKSNQKVALGYWVGSEHAGQGLGTKAAGFLTRYAFETLKLNRVEIHAATGNIGSQKIAEALGFKKEGTLRQIENLYGKFVDHFVYAKLKDEEHSFGAAVSESVSESV